MVAVIIKIDIERRMSGLFPPFTRFGGKRKHQDRVEDVQAYFPQDQQQLPCLLPKSGKPRTR